MCIGKFNNPEGSNQMDRMRNAFDKNGLKLISGIVDIMNWYKLELSWCNEAIAIGILISKDDQTYPVKLEYITLISMFFFIKVAYLW